MKAEEIQEITEQCLPEFAEMCRQPDCDTVMFQQGAFGEGATELWLMAVAIRYALRCGKSVHVVCGQAAPAQETGGPKRVGAFARVAK